MRGRVQQRARAGRDEAGGPLGASLSETPLQLVEVVSGEEDVAVRPERSRRTAERIPGARFVLLPRAGHTSSLEQPEAVTAALRDFFASGD